MLVSANVKGQFMPLFFRGRPRLASHDHDRAQRSATEGNTLLCLFSPRIESESNFHVQEVIDHEELIMILRGYRCRSIYTQAMTLAFLQTPEQPASFVRVKV
jgi:hypothetical protein